jgi:hypothetical protein
MYYIIMMQLHRNKESIRKNKHALYTKSIGRKAKCFIRLFLFWQEQRALAASSKQ